MKSIHAFLTALCILVGNAQLEAQDAEVLRPEGIRMAAGITTTHLYTAQVALGRIANGSYDSVDDWNLAIRDASGIRGAAKNVFQLLSDTRELFPEHERTDVDELIQTSQLIIEQADALIPLLRARYKGEGVRIAQIEFDSKRSQSAVLLEELGFDEDLVK